MADDLDEYTPQQRFECAVALGVIILTSCLEDGAPEDTTVCMLTDFCFYMAKGIRCDAVQLSNEIYRQLEIGALEYQASKATKQ